MASSKEALWAAGHDEAVEVNQRALIDKILARYSGEFTVFRELLQNSDDAEARSVEIRFETVEYLSREKGDEPQSDESEQEDLPDLKTAQVHRWTFKNNGMPFREEDWNRLKKIADGNPDEEKIGAFGVGFYSLFSITEEPWVTSGGNWMNFYWKDKKDHLYVRRGTEGDAVDAWTTFQITLREPGPMPPAFDFTRFLVSSIAFMTHLSEVSVYFDDKRLVKLSKSRGVSKEVPMLKELKGTSPERMMNVKSIQTTPLHIKAEVVELVYKVGSEKPSVRSKTDILKSSSHKASGFFSPLSDRFEASPMPQGTPTQAPVVDKESIDLLEANSSNIVLTIFAVNVDVRLDKKMAGELLRATKKNPPSRLRYELIYTGKDEYDSNVRAEEEAAYATGSVFQGLRADLEGTGSARVFIGHSTGQATGIGGHMATRFIPTVERESIDLVDRNVAVWNKELLYVGGFLARSAYELELDAVKRLWEGAAASNGADGLPDEEVQTRLRGRALHALKFFSFHPSTPSPMVSSLMETAFFACTTTRPFPIIASDGVRNASEVYILHPEFSGFIKHLPVISEDIVDGARTMIASLRSRGMIKYITFVDVLDELRSRPLSETETVECLKWWIGVTKEGNELKVSQERSQLLHALVVSVTGSRKKTMKLSDAQTFLKSKTVEAIIPTNGPLPSTLLPTSITCSFDRDTLSSTFPWRQLSIVDWLRHLTDPKVAAANPEFDVTKSALWAEQVLSVLVRAWPRLTKTNKKGVIGILSPMSCIPTSTGLKVPNQAYFPNVDLLNLFRDLPIVTMPSGTTVEGTLEVVLQSLGVRKHVELQIIFDRMVETGDWTTYDLVNYLVSIQPPPTSEEFQSLRETSAFPKENAGREQLAAGASRKVQRYKAEDLYEPIDIFRELGLPIIDWGTDNEWDPKSNNARFIYSLGLRRAPPLRKILHIAASDNPTLRTKALTFFLDNLYDDYNPQDFWDLAFVPAVLGSEKMLAKPFKVCTDPKWTALGFAVVDPMLPDGAARKLRLNHHPLDADLVTLLERSPPEDETTACKWFEILSDHVSGLSLDYLQILSETPFVPVESTGYKGDIKRLQPRRCFLGKQRSELHSKLFAFVDFGTRANEFLKCCHTGKEPSAEDIAQVLLADPRRVYELANGRENYLPQLRELARERDKLGRVTIVRMRCSKILLGSRRVKRGGGNASIGADKDDWYLQDELLRPSEVVIEDDTNAYQLFGDRIFCAPQDDIIEKLYLFLGSPKLSSLVREDYRTSRELPNSKIAAEIKDLILDRLPLFLHNQSSSRTKLSSAWLNNEKNLIVKVLKKNSVTRSLHHGNIHESTRYDISAIAKQEGSGPIELLLAGDGQISTSLCRVIFESPDAHDAASFMIVLQSDLGVLEKLGYPVERILRQKAEREVAEKAIAETEALLISSAPEMTVQETQTEISTTQPKIPSLDMPIPAPSSRATPGNTGPEQTSKRSKDISPQSKSVPPPPSPNIPITQPKIPSMNMPMPAPSSQATPGNTGPEQTSEFSSGVGGQQLPNRSDASLSSPTFPPKSEEDILALSKPVPPLPSLNTPIPGQLLNRSDASLSSPTFPPKSEDILAPSKSVPPPPSSNSNIPTTQPKMPPLNTPIPAPSSQGTLGNTGPEQTTKLLWRFGRRRLPNSPDASSSRLTLPPKSEDKPGPPRGNITPLSNIAYSVDMAIKRCTPERGNLLRNIANNINIAVGERTPESDETLLELANGINMSIEASVPESDNLLKRLLNNINATVGIGKNRIAKFIQVGVSYTN
ncbi:hypothetical protein F5888DRAFT_1829389 [Russula emetica]|nr:hypothetical protein F5888DRAFT_1829389 [Russula emetica]